MKSDDSSNDHSIYHVSAKGQRLTLQAPWREHGYRVRRRELLSDLGVNPLVVDDVL